MSHAVSSPSALADRPALDRRGVEELDRQVEVLVERGYPGLLGVEADALRGALAPLRDAVRELPAASDVDPADHVPFVLVVVASPATGAPLDLVAAAGAMTLGRRPAHLMIAEDEIAGYVPIDGIELPVPDDGSQAFAYLLTDVDTGSEFCNVRPEDALREIRGCGRTPLTIAEGVALVTARPDMLRPNKCFSLLGSRRGDQRVPAIWISQRAPKLGWCWDRNPHTWLGSASAGDRI